MMLRTTNKNNTRRLLLYITHTHIYIYIYIYIYIQGFGYRDIWGVVHIGWRDKNVSTTFSCRAVI